MAIIANRSVVLQRLHHLRCPIPTLDEVATNRRILYVYPEQGQVVASLSANLSVQGPSSLRGYGVSLNVT